MRILITGSQGFVGHHLYNYLKDKGHDVFGIDIIGDYKQNGMYMDLRDDVPKLFNIDKWDIIFHLASDVGGINYIEQSGCHIMRENAKLDANVIKYAQYYAKKLVYFSSSCVYDNNAYGKEKAFAEEMIKETNIDYLIVRPQNIYGLEDTKYAEREQVIMALFRQAYGDNMFIALRGTGKEKRSFVWITDLFDLIMENLKYKNKIIDAGGEYITINNLAKKIIKIAGKNKPIIHNLLAKEKPKKYIKFKRPKITIDKRLKQINNWILQNGIY